MDFASAVALVSEDCDYTNTPLGTVTGRPHQPLARLLRPGHHQQQLPA
jgi:hypothetical protein